MHLALIAAGSTQTALAFIEIGALVLGLAILARVAGRLGITAVPLYLLAGLVLGEGGLVQLDVTEDFISIIAEIGVLLPIAGPLGVAGSIAMIAIALVTLIELRRPGQPQVGTS